MIFHTGYKTERKLYRDVIKNKNLADYRAGFYARRNDCKSGAMWHLKGNNRILLAAFGNIKDVVES